MWISFFLACDAGDSAKDSDSGTTGETDSATEPTDSETTETGEDSGDSTSTIPFVDLCGIHFSEQWAFDGECPRMKTPCELTVADEASCRFDIAYSSGMTMGMPYEMTISGMSVSFGDGDQLTGCTGTVIKGDLIEGSCDGGCSFELYRETTR